MIVQPEFCAYALLQALGSERKGKVAPSGYGFLFSDSHSSYTLSGNKHLVISTFVLPLTSPAVPEVRNKSNDS